VLGDYAKVFSPEVLMLSKGDRHPTELAQFQSVRLALTSEPGSGSSWNDSRVKSLTGDARISARRMHGNFFEFARTHKTVVIGNHMPRINQVTHAMKRRMEMIPFRAVFEPQPGTGIRERLKAEAGGAILAWLVDGVRMWQQHGTNPPDCVRELTAEYIAEQDVLAQWLEDCCLRDPRSFELANKLHENLKHWSARQGIPPESNAKLSEYLRAIGFERKHTGMGNSYYGIRIKE
jgi:putative DNA primase/helicase